MCGRKVFLQLQMSHTLVPMTKVNVRGSSKAPNDAVWMSFPYSLVSSYSLTPFPFDFSLKQPQRVLIPVTIWRAEAGGRLLPEPRRCCMPRCGAPVPLTLRGVSQAARTHRHPQRAPGIPAPPPRLPIPPPSEVELVTKRAAGIVIPYCELSPFE